jgi:hypothetical protein
MYVMSRPELKEKLTRLINSLDDDELLQEIYQLINEDKDIYKLTEEQKLRLTKARQQIKDGYFATHDEVKKRTSELFH